MSFLDKARAQAEQAMAKAQQGLNQGQAKIDELQATRAQNELFRALGFAVYQEKRHGGLPEAVESALAALDRHMATEQGPGASSGGASAGGASAGGASASSPPAGDFTLE